jgi:FlaA1/EpsC-like NDP-sugar epimerase
MMPVWHWLLRKRGLYESRRGKSRLEEARLLVEASTVATAIVAVVTLFLRQAQVSGLVLVLSWGLAAGGLVLVRVTLRSALIQLRVRGLNQRRVLIVGTGGLAHAVWQRFRGHPEDGFRVIGFVGPWRASLGGEAPGVLGTPEEIATIVEDKKVDQVVIAVGRAEPVDPSKIIHELQRTAASVRIVPDLEGFPAVGLGIEDFGGIPMIRLV